MEKTLFDKLYSLREDMKKKLKRPLIKKQLKHKFESAHDDIVGQIIDKYEQMNKLFENIETLDIEKLVEMDTEVNDLITGADAVAKHYKMVFGEEMETEDFTELQFVKAIDEKDEEEAGDTAGD